MTHGSLTKSAVQKIVESLEQQIIFGSLLPKQRLYEDECIVRYDAKRHVIRAAFQELERRGVVQCIPNRGTIVRFYTRQEVNDLYVVRAILHQAGAERIHMPAHPSWLKELHHAQKAHARAVRDGNLANIFRSNSNFHRKLFEGTGNPQLVEAIEQSNFRTHGIRSHGLSAPKLLKKAQDEHRAMIRCIEEGDLDALVKLCILHMNPARHFYEEKYCAPIQWETNSDK